MAGLRACSKTIEADCAAEQALILCFERQLCRRADALMCRRCLGVPNPSALFGTRPGGAVTGTRRGLSAAGGGRVRGFRMLQVSPGSLSAAGVASGGRSCTGQAIPYPRRPDGRPNCPPSVAPDSRVFMIPGQPTPSNAPRCGGTKSGGAAGHGAAAPRPASARRGSPLSPADNALGLPRPRLTRAMSAVVAALACYNAPSERSAVFRCRLFSSAAAPPLASRSRKSDRCTATRLIVPSNSTSTARHPCGWSRIT